MEGTIIMIKGIGIDLIELDRIRKSLEQGEQLIQRILTDKEKEAFYELNSQKRKIEYLAGRFAAKEAFAKATGDGIGKLSFKDIEILKNEKGAPTITALGYEHYKIFISITHTSDYAAVQVVIEERDNT